MRALSLCVRTNANNTKPVAVNSPAKINNTRSCTMVTGGMTLQARVGLCCWIGGFGFWIADKLTVAPNYFGFFPTRFFVAAFLAASFRAAGFCAVAGIYFPMRGARSRFTRSGITVRLVMSALSSARAHSQ